MINVEGAGSSKGAKKASGNANTNISTHGSLIGGGAGQSFAS
jgi:hypothetical protein